MLPYQSLVDWSKTKKLGKLFGTPGTKTFKLVLCVTGIEVEASRGSPDRLMS
ncbi:predicted protein [Sclerotinia sclerotiorum 1980 UF-70]|uniref:Uncharacterized protein n=1 Tax=Sclerotinia sclerotiorum (strain ATCC 18683 / 1980 / Ss-1) TaxID=665079 RepID=A7E7E7_SCLS1|nr:predicted protein [Sclerotinia sclerotiorum 1980 UF-70]EDN96299.1 predicted protein [Sclerotinia sclerotiorum 1980 UF-70]